MGNTQLTSYMLRPRELTKLDAAFSAGVNEDPRNPEYYRDLLGHMVAHLPDCLTAFLQDFVRDDGQRAACLVRGLPIDDSQIGPTPAHWRDIEANRPTLREERYLAAVGAALGRPFTWQTLQEGRMIQDIVPIRGEEEAQSGHGSEALLEFHTEDGFHPNRCDYLLLLGVRNHGRTPTYLASVKDIRLADKHRDLLSEPRYYILPDDEHIKQLMKSNPEHQDLREMLAMRDSPPATSVLFGDADDPFLRIDHPFMRCASGDDEAREALAALLQELYRVKQSVVVDQGTLLVIDNYRAVHGRAPFRMRYDGTDRWLKRMIIRRVAPRGSLSAN